MINVFTQLKNNPYIAHTAAYLLVHSAILHTIPAEKTFQSEYRDHSTFLVSTSITETDRKKHDLKGRIETTKRTLQGREHSYMTSDFWVGRQVKPHLILLNKHTYVVKYLMRVGRQVKNARKTSDVIYECSLIIINPYSEYN